MPKNNNNFEYFNRLLPFNYFNNRKNYNSPLNTNLLINFTNINYPRNNYNSLLNTYLSNNSTNANNSNSNKTAVPIYNLKITTYPYKNYYGINNNIKIQSAVGQ